MSDQCKHCIHRGNITICRSVECYQHESWYAQQQISEIQSLKQELDQLYNALKDPWCRISAERVPEGYFRLDATVSDKELVIFGIADENHNCDEMGCGTLDHVIYRIPIPPSPDITKGE